MKTIQNPEVFPLTDSLIKIQEYQDLKILKLTNENQ